MIRIDKANSTLPRTDLLAWAEALYRRYRLISNLVVHTLLFSAALFLAYLVRFEIVGPADWFYSSFLLWLPVFVVVKLIIFGKLGLFRSGWQYSGIRDIYNIVIGSLIFTALMYAMLLLFRFWPERTGRRIIFLGDFFATYSTGVLFLDFLASVFLVCTARLGFRLWREERRPISPEGVRRVLMVGAGNAAETIIREIFRMPVERYRVVGLVDDDPAKKGLVIHDIPVLGKTDDIRRICQEQEVEEIIVVMPSATRKQLARVIDLCSGTKLKFQALPGLGDLIDGRVTVSQVRPVDINDLLGREAVQLDNQAVAAFIRDRRVLITGAGGSIGSEMCRQVCRYQPAKLILLEQAENPLFDINSELADSFPHIPHQACVCDVYDRNRVMELWKNLQPQVVIHAAAHKHVPLMEHNPCEAVKNNILGTRNIADASCMYGVDEFVNISTDKAVNPSSIMGASKRVAEIYTQTLGSRGDCRTQFKTVRFGNVLGSAGSVVPTFRRQIAAGGPVKVTHPEMTRYFMTIPEASQLVLQAAAGAKGGQIMLLDMGEPVKILDLARTMITLSGFRPGEDIDIEFTGVRPGEKLFEELRTDGEDIQSTMHPKVLIWRCRTVAWDEVQSVMRQLEELHNCTDRQKIIETIRQLVPEYAPLNQPEHIETPADAKSQPQVQAGG